MDRPAGRGLPDDRRLTLVRDSDRRKLSRTTAARGERLAADLDGRPEDLLRIMLDLARGRIVLGDLAIRARQDPTGLVEHDRRGAGRSLIEGQDRRPGHAAIRR